MGLKKNLSLIYIVYFSRASVSLLLFPLLIRRLDTGWGLFASVLSFIQIAITAMEFGFGVSATKNVARNKFCKDYLNQIVSSIITIQFAIFIIIVLVGIPVIYLPIVHDVGNYLLIVLTILAQGLLPLWFLRGMEDLYFVSASEVVSKLVVLVFVFLFVNSDVDIDKVFLIYFIGSIVPTLLGYLYIYKRYLKGGSVLFDYDSLRSHLNEGLLFFGVRLSGMFVSVGGSLVLGASGHILLAGQFAIGERVLSAVRNLLFPAWDVVFPKLVALTAAEHNSAGKFRKISTIAMISFSLVTSLALFMFAPFLVIYFSGHENQNIVTLIKMMSAAPFLVAVINGIGLSYLVAQDSNKQFFWSIFMGSIFYFLFLLLLSFTSQSDESNFLTFLASGYDISLAISMVMVLYFFKKGDWNGS